MRGYLSLFLFLASLFAFSYAQDEPTPTEDNGKKKYFYADLLFMNRIGYYGFFKDEQIRAWRYAPIGEAKIGFKGEQANVKGEFTPEFRFTNEAVKLDVYRAYVKFRFEYARFTLGKSTFSWGEGVYFNAGDLLFLDPLKSTNVATNDANIRDNARWLSSLGIPIGLYGMYEAVAVAPPYSFMNLFTQMKTPQTDPKQAAQAEPPPSVADTSVGNRFLFKVLGIQTQIGYLFTGQGLYHRPYVSLQGNFLDAVDYYVSSSVSIRQKNFNSEQVKGSWLLDVGFYYPIKITNNSMINLRLENQFIPLGVWKKESDPIDVKYGHQLFFDASYRIDQWTITLRNILSSIDVSDRLVFLVNWNVYQGLSLIFSVDSNIGGKNSLFSSNKDSSTETLGISLGARYIY